MQPCDRLILGGSPISRGRSWLRTLLEEFAMRNLFVGSFVAASLVWGVGVAQNTQPGQAQPVQPRVGQQPVQPGQQLQPGQPAQPRQQFGQQEQPGRQGQGSTADQQIAACLVGQISNEIEIAQLAESKAQNAEVRQFAQQMVRDHTPSRDALRQLAGPLAAEGTQQRGIETAGRAGAGGLDWVGIHKEIGQKCLETVKKELSAKQSGEFEQCFMIQQAMAHTMMVDELSVLRNHASNELRQRLDKDLQTAQQHLQTAKDLAKK